MTLSIPDEIKSRATESAERLTKLVASLEAFGLAERHPELAIYATGSLGRGEMSPASDLDLFLVDTARDEKRLGQLQTIRVQSDLINAAEATNFPPFSRDGDFLQVHALGDLLMKLGRPDEDALNVFTARLLLMLESECLVGREAHTLSLETVIDRYWAEERERTDFQPVFLINDIVRYWKTLCVAYEGWRESPGRRLDPGTRVSLLKLKFNRLWLCFNGLAFLLLPPDSDGPSRVRGIEMARLKPVQRLSAVAERVPELATSTQRALDLYSWWLETSSAGSDATESWIAAEENYTEALSQAAEFGEIMHDIVIELARRRNLARFLLV